MTIWGIDVFAFALVVTLVLTSLLACALLNDIIVERSAIKDERR